MVRVALDTNVLAYAEAVNEDDRTAKAVRLIERLPPGSIVIPYQVLGELHALLVRKCRLSPVQAAARVLAWKDIGEVVGSMPQTLEQALDLSAYHQFSIWDATVVCAAHRAGCGLLLSEDMQHGFNSNGMTIVNPFHGTMHPRLAELLQ